MNTKYLLVDEVDVKDYIDTLLDELSIKKIDECDSILAFATDKKKKKIIIKILPGTKEKVIKFLNTNIFSKPNDYKLITFNETNSKIKFDY